ncbi:hypothetical protein GCM10008027_29100 [Pseudoalteromonas gelatinilytica]|uniref:DUF2267 domain-containing protein n=1 Tax=Pseudoalteromonas gelatinilytica TaxID=1703256 RepID=A0ABQ1TRW5_9GAMM|nr:hypothetical protein GCM10008027_29100 [Pseudoalteromonas profundi]
MDEKLQEIRELIANIENLFDPAVAAIIDKVMGNTSMTKLEFNAPVQNVITDNKGTVNIQTVSVAELKQIIDSLSNIKPQSKFSEVAKNTATQELSKLMANEVKGLTTETISWLKSVSSDLPAEIARNINSWLG